MNKNNKYGETGAKKWGLLLLSVSIFTTARSQTNDSINNYELKGVTIQRYRFQINEVKSLEAIHGTYITSGKKHEVIEVAGLPANLVEKTGRQIFAKLPGAFVYDMDGSGNQINIATRGLDPHRSWEFNVRQNGIMTNSDIYGYPASHYSPPMEAVQRIEVIRGAASLQYGSQFGGMVNYVTKQADTTRSFGFENITSVGSFGLLGTYNSIGGKKGGFTYFAYHHKRVANGYRENSRSEAQAQFLSLKYDFSKNLTLKAELGRSQYLYRIPGPLTDEMFRENPRRSTRSRNYFSPDIYVPSIVLDWRISPTTRINLTNSAVLGNRSSVQFIGFADVKDTIVAATGQYKPRQVDIDHFNSYSSEFRLLQTYSLGPLSNTLIGGLRYVNNHLYRRQQGKGTTGTDFDLSLTTPEFGRVLHFRTQNIALFIENLFKINHHLELSAGIRLENGISKMSGIISGLPGKNISQDIIHKYPLLGLSGQYRLNENNKIYGGWSQAYRPVIFSDLIPTTILEQTNPDLKDAFGHNAEAGLKGVLFGKLTYDVNFFQIWYKNRIGSLVLTDAAGQPYVFKTNIGDSQTNGLELYAEYKIRETARYKMAVFTATAYFDGRYLNGQLSNGVENADLTGNKLETVPRWTSRNGLQVGWKNLSATLQFSHVSESFSDALNTPVPSANGARGPVPGYNLWDFNMAYRWSDKATFRVSINNFTNRQYFTKRPTGYPGQGVWSSDGMGMVFTSSIKI